jgi:hypothetical protein
MDWLIDIPEFVRAVGDGPFKVIVAVLMYYAFKELQLLRKSVGKLHEAIAVIIERTSSHEKRISRLEKKK